MPGYPELFQAIPGHSDLFRAMPGYSGLFWVLLGYSGLFLASRPYLMIQTYPLALTTSQITSHAVEISYELL